MSHDLAGAAADVSVSFGYNPAGQIASRGQSNDGYLWPRNETHRLWQVNGLNQQTQTNKVGQPGSTTVFAYPEWPSSNPKHAKDYKLPGGGLSSLRQR